MSDAVPPGKINCVVTYLEMHEQPRRASILPAGAKIALLRAQAPTASFYRYLYNTVGEPWFWYQRREITDDDLITIIHDSSVAIYVLYVDGVPAGYAELDSRKEPDIELAYLGLVPEFIGRGLGAYLLGWVIDEAWQKTPGRLWVHTCNLDHPRAVRAYQRAGFSPYRQEKGLIDDPRDRGLIPRDTPLPPGADR
jgi:GNAT superfamily N-acetyltransferase